MPKTPASGGLPLPAIAIAGLFHTSRITTCYAWSLELSFFVLLMW